MGFPLNDLPRLSYKTSVLERVLRHTKCDTSKKVKLLNFAIVCGYELVEIQMSLFHNSNMGRIPIVIMSNDTKFVLFILNTSMDRSYQFKEFLESEIAINNSQKKIDLLKLKQKHKSGSS